MIYRDHREIMADLIKEKQEPYGDAFDDKMLTTAQGESDDQTRDE